MKKIINIIKANWQEITAFLSVFLLTSISVYKDYNLGMLVGFLILFLFFSYERIKRIIIELNIKKIFGVEFGDIDREEIVENVKKELSSIGTEINDSDIEDIADMALNQIKGVAYKGHYYEEMVGYALKDLNLSVQQSMSGAVGNKRFHIDFLIEIDDIRVIGIEVVYTNKKYVSSQKIDAFRQNIETISKVDKFAGFLLITNAEVRQKDIDALKNSSPSIEIIEKTVSPDSLLSKIGKYMTEIE